MCIGEYEKAIECCNKNENSEESIIVQKNVLLTVLYLKSNQKDLLNNQLESLKLFKSLSPLPYSFINIYIKILDEKDEKFDNMKNNFDFLENWIKKYLSNDNFSLDNNNVLNISFYFNLLHECYNKYEKYNESLICIDQSLDYRPFQINILYKKIELLKKLQLYNQAIQELEMVNQIDKNNKINKNKYKNTKSKLMEKINQYTVTSHLWVNVL